MRGKHCRDVLSAAHNGESGLARLRSPAKGSWPRSFSDYPQSDFSEQMRSFKASEDQTAIGPHAPRGSIRQR